MVAARRAAVRAERVVLVLLEGARHARAAREGSFNIARLESSVADAVEHRHGGLEDCRVAVQHGARGVGGGVEREDCLKSLRIFYCTVNT